VKRLGVILLVIVTAVALGIMPAVSISATDGCGGAKIWLEDVVVPVNNPAGVSSSTVLAEGATYCLEVSGTWQDTSQGNHYIDAEYTTFDSWATYMDGTANWGPNQKDLQVDGEFVDWGDYNAGHEYCLAYTGEASAVSFRIFDGHANYNPPEIMAGWYPDNRGSLTVSIYVCVENFVTGGGNIKDGRKVAWTFGGNVGFLESGDIVGQFQIVDHNGKESWHCHNDFSFLEFTGDPIDGPPGPDASHNHATFIGTFTSNHGDELILKVDIWDYYEPGKDNDVIKVQYWNGSDFEDWFGVGPEEGISGGNFQIHNVSAPTPPPPTTTSPPG
jgi:hypothetical protein